MHRLALTLTWPTVHHANACFARDFCVVRQPSFDQQAFAHWTTPLLLESAYIYLGKGYRPSRILNVSKPSTPGIWFQSATSPVRIPITSRHNRTVPCHHSSNVIPSPSHLRHKRPVLSSTPTKTCSLARSLVCPLNQPINATSTTTTTPAKPAPVPAYSFDRTASSRYFTSFSALVTGFQSSN